MVKVLFWMFTYSLIFLASQLILKTGLNQMGAFSIKGLQDILPLISSALKNHYVVVGTILLTLSSLFWITLLSWFKIGIVLPMTALTYVIVAIISSLLLGEGLSFYNYLGVVIITVGIYFLLYKIA